MKYTYVTCNIIDVNRAKFNKVVILGQKIQQQIKYKKTYFSNALFIFVSYADFF